MKPDSLLMCMTEKQGKIDMPPIHKEKNHCGINQGLEQNAWRGQVTSVLGGLSD